MRCEKGFGEEMVRIEERSEYFENILNLKVETNVADGQCRLYPSRLFYFILVDTL